MSETTARPKPPNFLEIHAGNHPEKTAIIGLERSLTFGELRERSRTLAKRLYHMGLRPGDQVALMTYNLPESLQAIPSVGERELFNDIQVEEEKAYAFVTYTLRAHNDYPSGPKWHTATENSRLELERDDDHWLILSGL